MGFYATINATTWADVTVPVYDKRWADNSESGTTTTASATVYYQVAWQNRWLFVQQVMGTPQASDYSNPVSLVRRLPLQYADNTYLYATSFSMTPIASPSGTTAQVYQPETAYLLCWVGITYSTLTYSPTTMYTVETSSGSERVTMPDSCYSFESDGLVINQDVGISIANQVKQITFYNVPYFDDSQFISYQDTVNATTFLGYPAGYLLFQPLTSRFSYGIGGANTYEVVMSLAWRSQPWNYCQRPNGVWEAVKDPSGNPPYGTSEFSNLIS
jgi:hypothetical protein